MKNKKKDNNNSKQILLSVLGVAILIVAVVGVSFAAFSYSKTGTQVNTITTGTISMNYVESDNAINLTNALPMTDDVGKALADENQYFDFTVSANITGTTTINYAITGEKVEGESTLPDAGVKVYLTDMDDDADSEILPPTKLSTLDKTAASEASGAPEGQFKLTTGTFSATSSHKYRLRMWVADDYTVTGESQAYKLKVNVYGAAAAQ